jgi:hypothetical protein
MSIPINAQELQAAIEQLKSGHHAVLCVKESCSTRIPARIIQA